MDAKPKRKLKPARQAGPRPTRNVQRIERPRLTLTPETLAVASYAAALSDPWDAGHVGIPWGAPLPTFKHVVFYEVNGFSHVNGTSTSVTSHANLGSFAHPPGEHFIDASVILSAGAVQFSRSTDDGGRDILRSVVISSGRLVAAAVRIVYEGRADDKGGSFTEKVIQRGRADTAARHPFSTTMEADYHPGSVFDLEFADSGTANYNTIQGTVISVRPIVRMPYFLQFVAIVESNDDSPPPISYTRGDYVTLEHSLTPSASQQVESGLHKITTVSRRSPPTKVKEHHSDPENFRGPTWLNTITKTAQQMAGFIDGGAEAVSSISQVMNSLTAVAGLIKFVG
jgi:hypothetical protein